MSENITPTNIINGEDIVKTQCISCKFLQLSSSGMGYSRCKIPKTNPVTGFPDSLDFCDLKRRYAPTRECPDYEVKPPPPPKLSPRDRLRKWWAG